MVSKYERSKEPEDRGYSLLSGIYRVVKSIDEKVESFLEEIREIAEARAEEDYRDRYWNENGIAME